MRTSDLADARVFTLHRRRGAGCQTLLLGRSRTLTEELGEGASEMGYLNQLYKNAADSNWAKIPEAVVAQSMVVWVCVGCDGAVAVGTSSDRGD